MEGCSSLFNQLSNHKKGLHRTLTVLCKNVKYMPLYICTQILSVISHFFFFLYHGIVSTVWAFSVASIRSMSFSCVIYWLLLKVSYISVVLQQWPLTQGPRSSVNTLKTCNISILCPCLFQMSCNILKFCLTLIVHSYPATTQPRSQDDPILLHVQQ